MADFIEIEPSKGAQITLINSGMYRVLRKQHKAEVRRAMSFILNSLHYVEGGGRIENLPNIVEIWKGERERLSIRPGKVTRRVNKLIREHCPKAVRPVVTSQKPNLTKQTHDL